MRFVRLTVAAAALAAAGFSSSPASAFPCASGTLINTGPQGVPGILTVQVCSEGVRPLPGPELTSASQVGVTVLGEEECVGLGRVTAGIPTIITWDDRGLFGTPVFLTCPGT